MSRIYSLYNNFKAKKYSYFVAYTVFFCFAAVLMFWYFPAFHKSFIWEQDGIKQHYNGLLYYAKYLKNILHTLISEHRFVLPMWDFSIGYGSDIITTLHYYAIGDPLTLLSVIVPVSLMEFFYAFLFFLRAYIGGLGFSFISLERGNSRFYTLIGSVIYCFSAFSLVLGLMHGIFMVPVCYFPWIIYGVDRIFKKKSPLIFIISVAAAAAANFYFLYMEVLLAVFYIIHLFICEEQDRYGERQSIKTYAADLFKRFCEFLLYGINSFLLSAFILLPVLNVLLSSKRLAAEKTVNLLYSFKHYPMLIADFMITRRATNWTLLGYTVIGAFSVLILLTDDFGDKELKRLRLRFAVLTLFAMIPFCGFMLNGFAYVVNRWIFAYALCTAMVTAAVLSRLEKFDAGKKSRLLRIVIVLICFGTAFFFVRSEESLLSMVLLLVTMMILMREDTPRGLFKPVILGVALISLFFNGWYEYSTAENDSLDEYYDFRKSNMDLLDDSITGIIADAGDDSFFRTEIAGVERILNSSIQNGLKGTQYYFSLTSSYISDYINGMYLNCKNEFDYEGAGSGTGPETLANVKYYIAGKDSTWKVPHGFRPISEAETASGEAEIFVNENALPLGFAVDEYIPRSEFDAAEITGRRNALITGAVIEDKDIGSIKDAGIPETGFTDESADVITGIEGSGDMDITSNSFTVRRNASVTVHFTGSPDSETCFYFKNLWFNGYKEREMYTDSAWGTLTPYEQAIVRDKSTTDARPSATGMMIVHNDHEQIIELYSPSNDLYCGRHDFLIDLGEAEGGDQSLTITFKQPGVYSFDAIGIRSQAVPVITDKISKLGEDPMTDIEVIQDEIRGRIAVDKNKLLMLSVPYSIGWKAFVDGNEADIYRADLMYMALPVAAGEHEIILKYETPYFRTGVIMGILGIIMLFMVLFCYGKKRSH
ncbi:MAG: YfhO family protein [Lachnospiraceae bacterium]|nr:YfhO family protein [Lachnospiraceae bacterium]